MSNVKPLVSLKNISVIYKTGNPLFGRGDLFTALDCISFDIYPGESIGIIGKNGAGKSTLLRLLSGVILPDRGELINHSKTTTLLALALGFDELLTGRRNTVMCGMLMGLERKEVEAHMDEIQAFADIGIFFDKPVKMYSSGMRSRLAFAIANVVQSDLLLIDEILAVGDADFGQKSRKAMEQKILGGATCVLVSHQPNDVRKLCHKTVWIEHGKIRMQGATEDVINAYEAAQIKQ